MQPNHRQVVTVIGKGVVLSGNNALNHLPVSAWSYIHPGTKYTGEVGLFIIAEFESYLRNTLFGIEKHTFGLYKFTCLDDLRYAFLEIVSADKIEIPFRHIHLVGIKRNTNITPEI